MSILIDNIDYVELPAEKFWSWPKSYKGNIKEETKNFILSGNYLCSIKKDGHYCRFIKGLDGQIRMQGRSKSVSGEYLDKHDFVPQLNSFYDTIPNGACLIGELYFPNQPGSRKVTTILGCLKDKALERQEKGEKLHYYIFDIWAWDGQSYLNKTMEQRVKALDEVRKYINEYVEVADYYEGTEAWDKLGEAFENNEEGMVITKRNSCPEPGKRTSKKTLKVKKQLTDTIDVFLTGNYKLAVREYKGKTPLETYSYWENIKTGEIFNTNKYNEYVQGLPVEPVSRHYALKYAGSVEIALMKDGKILPVGYVSGITDDMRKEIITNPDKFKGKVFELNCMEIEFTDSSANGFSFRHPKFVGERKDKNYLDCDISQIIGK